MSEPRRLLQMRFAAHASRLSAVRKAVRQALEEIGCGEECAGDVVMAVDEACQNIIRHAYGGECDERIELEIDLHGDELVLRLRDHAPAVDPSCVKPRDLGEVRPGGLGVHFIHEVMDDTRFVPCADGGNLLQMTKRLGLG